MNSEKEQVSIHRLLGLDFARFLALVGMVIVNFDVVMVNTNFADNLHLAELLQGKAAATFVVLAGIGLGLSAAKKPIFTLAQLWAKRFVFLFVLGMLNALIFQADIIHYYAFYFLFGVLCLRLPMRTLILTIIMIQIISFTALIVFDYDNGWDWQSYTYMDFWHIKGFIRNLFFNGWHPIFPWFNFFLFGLLLSRLKLVNKSTQWQMFLYGLLVFMCSTLLSNYLVFYVNIHDPQAAILFEDKPIPAVPFYMMVGGSFATILISGCLLLEKYIRTIKVCALITAAGQQTLTLYMAHIVIGMGWIEYNNMLANQNSLTALWVALIFCMIATIYSIIWHYYFSRGPLEFMMRKLCG